MTRKSVRQVGELVKQVAEEGSGAGLPVPEILAG
jgi:hypothetical protein